MLYWLRRNNIDKGPFTKEALLSQGLNTNDLIKVDGGSEWRSPDSFAELQPGTQSTQKPKYKFTADKKLIEIKEEASDKPGAQVPLANARQDAGGPSPFKRIPSALPKKKPAATPIADQTAINNIEKAKERARLQSKGDKPADPAQQPQSAQLQAHTSQTGHQKLHTQVQSLDEAPLRELRHHPTPKPVRNNTQPRNSNFFKEFFLPIVIIGGIGFLVWWGYKQFTSPAATDSIVTAPGLVNQDSAAMARAQSDSENAKTAKTAVPAAIPVHHTSTVRQATDSTRIKDSSKIAAVHIKPVNTKTATSPSAESMPATQKDIGAAGSKTTTTVKATPAEKKEDTPGTVTAAATTPKKEAEKKTAGKNTQKTAGIGDYISLSLNKTPEPGIRNIKLKVQNTSSDDLNIAVIEVKYYDKDGKFIQGETLQTGKISAGKSTTLKIPSSRAAERISYKVSLISGDNVYLMGR